ncbi:MAG: zinc ribbon domain-containing protein [Clostridiales bacterium]|nr:zinc ribbon domain-containing protein [Clostridiales bacterium]
MFCKNCGREMDDSTNYCSSCGAALNARAETATLERIGMYAYDKSDPLYNIIANRKETPVRGSLSVLPLFGVMGVVLMVVTLMVTLYSYSMIDGLQKNLLQYYNQMSDDSLVGQIGGAIMDFFTDGALTQKREDVKKMEQDLIDGRNIMSAGLACALASVLFALGGVMRNIKKPAEGRVLFALACLLSVVAPLLVFIAYTRLYLINTFLIVTITSSALAFIMLIIESQRVKIIRAAYIHNHPHKRPVPVKAARE